MAYNESDDKLDLLREIRQLENELAGLKRKMSDISMRCKWVNHRLADLRYELKQRDKLD